MVNKTVRVLVVEDDEAFNYSVCRSFELAGAETVAAHTGAEALRMARESRFDIMVVDILLGDTNGKEVLEKLSGLSDAVKVAISGADDALTGIRPSLVQAVFRKEGDVPRLAASLVDTVRQDDEVPPHAEQEIAR